MTRCLLGTQRRASVPPACLMLGHDAGDTTAQPPACAESHGSGSGDPFPRADSVIWARLDFPQNFIHFILHSMLVLILKCTLGNLWGKHIFSCFSLMTLKFPPRGTATRQSRVWGCAAAAFALAPGPERGWGTGRAGSTGAPVGNAPLTFRLPLDPRVDHLAGVFRGALEVHAGQLSAVHFLS